MQKGSSLPLMLVGLFTILVPILYYYNFYSDSETVTQVKTKSIPSSTPAKSSRIIPNDLLGLEFEIPDGYNLKKETEQEYFKRANGDIRKNFTYYVQYSPAQMAESFYIISDSENNLDKASLSVWIFKNPDNLNPEKFYGKFWYYPFVWGDFTDAKNKIAPESGELIGGKEGKSGTVDYREGKPKFIYLPLNEKNLMLQIQIPTEGNQTGKEILESFKFE